MNNTLKVIFAFVIGAAVAGAAGYGVYRVADQGDNAEANASLISHEAGDETAGDPKAATSKRTSPAEARPATNSDAGGAPAQETAAGNNDPWGLGCNEDTGICQIHQNIIARETGRRLLTVIIRPRPDGNGENLLISAPHGVFLPAGVTFEFNGEKSETIPFETSEQAGPLAITLLTPEILESLEGEKSEFFIIVEDQSRKQYRIPVMLAGFSVIHAELQNR